MPTQEIFLRIPINYTPLNKEPFLQTKEAREDRLEYRELVRPPFNEYRGSREEKRSVIDASSPFRTFQDEGIN